MDFKTSINHNDSLCSLNNFDNNQSNCSTVKSINIKKDENELDSNLNYSNSK